MGFCFLLKKGLYIFRMVHLLGFYRWRGRHSLGRVCINTMYLNYIGLFDNKRLQAAIDSVAVGIPLVLCSVMCI